MLTGQAEDYIEIQQTLYRYCRGVDRGDAEATKACFFPDATDHHGDFDGLAHDLVDRVVARGSAYPFGMQHHITNTIIDVDGDRANVESFFLSQVPYRGDDGAFILMHMGGRYLDRFERRRGEWRIARRKVVIDWSKHLDGPEWPRRSVFPGPGRREEDPSHAFFAADWG